MAKASSEIEHYILEDNSGCVILKKLSDQGGRISPLWSVGGKWGGEIREELSQLIKERLKAKRKLLEKKGVLDQCKSVILLFYDAYHYSNIDYIREALSKVQCYDWLHSIFVAVASSDTLNKLYPDSPGRKGMFLYSKNKLWK